MRLIGLVVVLALQLALSAVDAEAQPATIKRIGFLSPASPAPTGTSLEAFRQGLRELGWIEGQTVTIEYRWAAGDPQKIQALATDLVQLKVDVIVTTGAHPIRVVKETTSTIPVVFVVLTDPVGSGLVASLARPGGNLTGLASQFEELITKQPQLVKEALPTVTRIAVLHRPESATGLVTAAENAARNVGFSVRTFKVGDVPQYENAFRMAQKERCGAILVLPSPIFNSQRRRLIDLAAQYRLPAIYEFKDYVQDGGLMSYGPNITRMFRGAANYVDRILRGARPGDLPIERPATFELAINLKTARALGLTISPSVLGRADEMIE
jgi:putative ABC transport system substrate-binding protein